MKKLENDRTITCKIRFIHRFKFISSSLECNKNHKKYFNKDLIERFTNTYELCTKYKFCLMLRIGIYPYEYIDSRKRFNEAWLPDKEEF